MKAEEEFKQLYQRMSSLCAENNWGDPLSYARAKEIYAAIELGHNVSSTLSGADAFNQLGQPVEYKSTIDKKVKGSYTGISRQSTWGEQVRYLKEEKIAKYPEHFFNRFKDGKLVESWRLSGKQVFDILLPKLKKQYPNAHNKKDPRLNANITYTEIMKYAKRII